MHDTNSAHIDEVVIGVAESKPILVVGEDAEGDAISFTSIAGVFSLEDGTIVVGNSYSPPSIYWFSENGVRLKSVGRQGAGPSEFKDLRWIQRAPGDTIVAFDRNLSRITRFTRTGEFVDTGNLVPSGFGQTGALSLIGLASDTLGLALPMFSFSPNSVGKGRSELPILSVNLTSGAPRQILRVRGTEFVPREKTGRAMSLMFGKSTEVVVHDKRIFVVDGEKLGAAEYSVSGEKLNSFETPATVRQVSKRDIDAELERVVFALAPSDRKRASEEARSLRHSIKAAEMFPVSGGYAFGPPGPCIIVDDDGRVGS